MKLRACLLSLLCLTPLTRARDAAAAHESRMQWWREARFGMFVHWGLYSGLAGSWEGRKVGDSGGMEWIQSIVGADTASYAAAARPKFQPKPGFATQWARVAKQAGCRYVVFTTKHHEGFALHDSKLTDYDAGDFVGRDLVKEIVDALHAEGLKVGFYHSLIDWHHPQYDFTQAKGLPYPKGAAALATTPRDHEAYIRFLHGQVDELMSRYGKVDVLWWDYSSTAFDGDKAWKAGELIASVRARQPDIIMNNRLYRRPEAGFDGMGTTNVTNRLDPKYGDFVTPENHIPATGLPGVDWETCMTMNTTWGFSEHDRKWKSSEVLIRNLIDIASKGGNYLLNVGPAGDGAIPEASVECMAAIGAWLKTNGESIYGSTASPLENPGFEGRITRKDKALYLHLFKRPESGVITLASEATRATLLSGTQPLKTRREGGSLTIELPDELPDPIATVIRLD